MTVLAFQLIFLLFKLLSPDFSSRLFELISEMNVNPGNISIEITESVFAADYDHINNIIEKLRAVGIRVAVDDFGTGYSSLAREKELKVDCLKIDKFFVDNLLDTDPNSAITSDIISMSQNINRISCLMRSWQTRKMPCIGTNQ